MTHEIKNEKSIGASPGTLLYVGKERSNPVGWTAVVYDAQHADIISMPGIETLPSIAKGEKKLWLKVSGVHDAGIVSRIGAAFGIHPLVLEDILNTHQRPKVDDYGNYLFFVLRNMTAEQGSHGFEQLSVILGKDFVISFEEGQSDQFAGIMKRLHELKGRLPVLGADYLTYRLLDSIVDSYFQQVSNLEDRIDHAEERLVSNHEKFKLEEMFRMRQETVTLKKAIAPLRDFISFFRNSDTTLLSHDIGVFLMDFTDHVTRVSETIETCRETLTAMMELYVSQSDRKLNEVMKVLTVISTIFIPLGFLTSYFGMNFKGMFEYDMPNAYPIFVALLLVIVVLQLVMFRRRRWI